MVLFVKFFLFTLVHENIGHDAGIMVSNKFCSVNSKLHDVEGHFIQFKVFFFRIEGNFGKAYDRMGCKGSRR